MTGATAYHLILPGIVDTLLVDTVLSVCGLDEDSDYGFGVYAHVGDEVGHFSGLHPFHTLLYCMPLASLSANVDGIVRGSTIPPVRPWVPEWHSRLPT